MIVCKEPAQAIHIRLSQCEGRQLLALLDHLAAEDGGPSDSFVLSSAAEKLGDSCAVAAWLHENVELDLPIDEAFAVIQAIEANLAEIDPLPPLAASLRSAWRRIVSCIPCEQEATT